MLMKISQLRFSFHDVDDKKGAYKKISDCHRLHDVEMRTIAGPDWPPYPASAGNAITG